MTKIFITGGVGFVMPHMVHLLLEMGYESVILDDIFAFRESEMAV